MPPLSAEPDAQSALELWTATPPPPGPLRLPAQFEPQAELHVVFPAWDAYDRLMLDIVAATVDEGTVVVHLCLPSHIDDLETQLAARGLTDRVRIGVTLPIDTGWIRDFGPVLVESRGRLVVVDGRYFRECAEADVFASRFGEARSMPVHRTPFFMEGGNLLTDGAGTCFTTTWLADQNGLSADEMARVVEEWFGCEQVIFLEPLRGRTVAHVDMVVLPAGPDHLLVGAIDPRVDPVNARVLDRNARILSHIRSLDGRRYRITRVPMPGPVDTGDGGRPVVRSSLNALLFNGVVLVPGYDDVDPEPVLAVFREAFPGRRLVVVPADEPGRDEGAVHCLTHTVPAGVAPARGVR